MRTDDQYPSTFDSPPICGAQDDPVLMTLENARGRIEANHSRSSYLPRRGRILPRGYCAVGAVLAEQWSDASELGSEVGSALIAELDAELRDEVRVAIDLLNEAALARHPEARDVGWSGPLEWVNQDWEPDPALARVLGENALVKEEILAIYDDAIAERKGEMVPA